MLETPLIQNQYPESDLLLSPPTAIPGAEPTSPLVCLNATASSPGCFLYCILKRNRSESIPQEHGRPLPERCSASPLPSGSRTLHHSAPCDLRSPHAHLHAPFQHLWPICRSSNSLAWISCLCSSSSLCQKGPCSGFTLLMFLTPSRLFSNFVTGLMGAFLGQTPPL